MTPLPATDYAGAEPVDEDLDDDGIGNCGMYFDEQLKRWTCPQLGGEYCDFPSLNCTGGS